jgi:hypothetical protein
MTSAWKIAVPVACVAVIGGAAILWPAYKEEAMERKLADATRERAEQSDAHAQKSLGSMYYEGNGVRLDYVEAVRWYRKAADQGYVKAQSNLASMYHYGKGVPQDYTEVVLWARKAAERGDAVGQAYLGGSYAQGQGVPQDYAEAVRWYRKAACFVSTASTNNNNQARKASTGGKVSAKVRSAAASFSTSDR